jgi:hypothetical protein
MTLSRIMGLLLASQTRTFCGYCELRSNLTKDIKVILKLEWYKLAINKKCCEIFRSTFYALCHFGDRLRHARTG